MSPRPRWWRRADHALDEGMLLATRAAVLDVRNRIEVATIGRGEDFDPAEFHAVAVAALQALADEQDAVADRLDEERRAARGRRGTSMSEHDYRRSDRRNLKRRATAARLLAAAIRARATDGEQVDALVERARVDAWDDVARQIRRRMQIYSPVPEADADPDRRARIAGLAADLVRQRAARSTDLGD